MGRAVNRRSSIVEQVGTLASPAAATAAIRDVYYSQDWQALEERVRTSPSQVAATADTRFIWSPVYVDAMVARDRNADNNATTGTGGLEQRVYALQDANWNTTAIIAATGVPGVSAAAVINRFAYTPYGEVQALTASWATPPAGSTPAVPWAHLFQGLEFTDVTGLAYVRHRDYSATLGRFIEMDPIGFSAGDNNWYRFVANGPTGKVDPSGLAEGYNSINEWLTGPVPQLSQAEIEQLEQLKRMLRARPSQPSPAGFVSWQGRDGSVSCIGRMHRGSGHSPDGHPISGSAALDAVQAGLDLFGLVPGAGEVFDGLNGLISLGRGDYTGAGLSFAAMVPVGGQAATAAKFGLKYGDEVAAAGRCAANRVQNTTPSPALRGSPYHPDSVAARVRPPYRANPAHDPRSLKPRKTPEPSDAASVYGNAVRSGMAEWFGVGADGKIYRFFGDNAGGVHFSGIVPKSAVPKGVRGLLGL